MFSVNLFSVGTDFIMKRGKIVALLLPKPREFGKFIGLHSRLRKRRIEMKTLLPHFQSANEHMRNMYVHNLPDR